MSWCQSYTKVALIFQHPFLIGLQKSDKFSGDHLKKPALSSIWPYTYIVKKTARIIFGSVNAWAKEVFFDEQRSWWWAFPLESFIKDAHMVTSQKVTEFQSSVKLIQENLFLEVNRLALMTLQDNIHTLYT